LTHESIPAAPEKAPADLALATQRLDALFTRNADGDLFTLNELEPVPPPTPAPRIYLGVTSGGTVRGYRHDVSLDLRAKIDQVGRDAAQFTLPRQDLLSRLREALTLHDAGAGWQVSSGPAFVFPETVTVSEDVVPIGPGQEALLAADFPFTATWLRERWPCYGIVVDGRAVSVCYSARRTDTVAEAGVDTAETFRGRGYAALVTAAWAQAIRAAGITPVYSTSDDNHASQAVARKLGLREFGWDVSVE
jgi:hypothetical protein